MYKIKFCPQGATEGTMKTIEVPMNKTMKLPKNKFKRRGYKFVGWAIKSEGVVNMDHLQVNKVRYKNQQKIRNLGKNNTVVKLYACWRGYGAEAACRWARRIARDNSFAYGVGSRAHHCGCYFCGTNITGAKHAKKGSAWEKTYCCNPFVFACFVHGANLWKKCVNSSLRIKWWTKLKQGGKSVFKVLGKNLKYSKLNPGDVLIRENRHVKIFLGKNKKGQYTIAHAAGEGWGSKSIRVDVVKGRIGSDYTALKYIGR